MKYKSKFKRVRAQAGMDDILGSNGPQLLPDSYPNYNWMQTTNPSIVNPAGVTPGPVVSGEGTPNDIGKIVPLERDQNGSIYATNEKKFKVGTGRYKENPYVKAFNETASEVTGIANLIQNNRLKNKEYDTLVHSLEPHYWENMESEGLNNLPMYTQYGGSPTGFGPNLEDPGFAHEAFYGDISIYAAGGYNQKYAAGGLSAEKAKIMLQEGTANGHPLTDAQKRYFGWVAGGRKAAGGNWIAGAIKHPGRCANPGDENCPEGSPQYELAMRFKHGDLHKQAGGCDDCYEEMKAGGKWIPKDLHKGRCANPGDANCPKGSRQYNLAMTFKKHHGFHKQTGGTTNVNGYDVRRLSPSEMQQWNQYLDYVKGKGYEGSEELNVKSKNLGANLFTSFKKENPGVTIDYSIVPSIQNEMQLMKNTAQGFAKRHNDPNADKLMADISPVDNWFGSKTSQYRFPSMVTETYNNGQLTNRQDLGLVNSQMQPVGSMDKRVTQPGQTMQTSQSRFKTLSGSVLPLGTKVEKASDGFWYYENRDGDLVRAEQMKTGGKNWYQTGGGLPQVHGLPDELDQFADVNAEAGEVIQTQDGSYIKVADNANTHEQGGEMIPNVSRVLEDTSDKRKDKASKILKVDPAMMKEAFGVTIKSPVTHAKAFEIAKTELDKANKQYQTSKSDANLRTNIDKTAMNTLRLNQQFQGELPTEDDIFNLLFLHQEGVKHANGINDDGSMTQYGGKKQKKGVYQTGGGLKGKTNVSKDLKTPKGNVNQVNYPGGLPALVDKWKAVIPGIENVTDPAEFQRKTYDYLLKNQPDLIDQTIWGEGLNRQGINMYKSGKDKAFNEAVNRAFDPKTFAPKKDYQFTQADREALGKAYPDSYLMNRLVVPDVTTTTTNENVPEEQKKMTTPGTFNPNVNINPKFVRQPNNDFYEPTYWSDIAAPTAGLVDSMRRLPELYNPVEFHQLRFKLLDPTAALTANQADFNAAVDESNNMNTGAGNANKATMLGQKYRANNQVLSQYDNQNAGIKNNEITYNTQVRDKQSVADAQSRGDFYNKVLLGREAQRQQYLTSLGQLSRVDQLKRRQNASGNLLMKLSPAFNQFGEYNGYQYLPYLDPSMVNYNENSQPVKMTSKKGKTRSTTTWKDAAGTVHKTTTSD